MTDDAGGTGLARLDCGFHVARDQIFRQKRAVEAVTRTSCINGIIDSRGRNLVYLDALPGQYRITAVFDDHERAGLAVSFERISWCRIAKSRFFIIKAGQDEGGCAGGL